MTDPLGHAATYAYNAAGEMTSATDRIGRVRNFGYDAVGRETSETWMSGTTAIYTATYNFDPGGRLTQAYDTYSSYSLGYDNANRLTSVDNLNTPNVPHVILTYSYDGYNNRTSLTDNQNGSVSFGFDADHRLTSIGLSILSTTNATLTFNYDAVSRLTSLTRTPLSGDTISTTLGYDNDNRLTNLTHTDTTKSPALTLASYTYGYDNASRLNSYSGPDGSLNYGYDNDNQLTSVTGARSENFTYDHNGNRTMAGYTTGADNRLTSDGVYNYTYDNEGNLSTQTQISNGSVTYYTWDYRNRLTQEQVKDSLGNVLSTETFTYDVNNNRIGMYNSVSGTTTWTVFDGANPYLDFNGTTLTERYLTNPQGLSQFYARVSPSGTANWYLTDNINSVRQIIDTSGNVLDALTYSSFGNILTETNAANGDRFKYAGGAYDSITGNDQFGRRYENPADGRFVSQDPLGFGAGDTNMYRYVFNAPTYLTDPSGFDPLLGIPPQATSGPILMEQINSMPLNEGPPLFEESALAYGMDVNVSGLMATYYQAGLLQVTDTLIKWDKKQPKPGKGKVTGSGTYEYAPPGAVKADIQVAYADATGRGDTYKFGSGIGTISKPAGAKRGGTWKFDTSKRRPLIPPGKYKVQVYIRFFDKNNKIIGKDIPGPKSEVIEVTK